MSTELYVAARAREGRLLPDEVVAALPHVAPDHPHACEWAQRAESAERLVRHLRDRPRPARVVELGCGNGWLSNRIAARTASDVLATDVNDVELDQARRVFRHRDNLRFAHHDMRDARLPGEADVLVVASALQYVADAASLIAAWLRALRPHGEIHVLDTPIYTVHDVAAARERSRRHYAEIGVPEMAAAYHHHTWDELAALRVDVLYRPDATTTRTRRRLTGRPRSPFPWLRVRRDANP